MAHLDGEQLIYRVDVLTSNDPNMSHNRFSYYVVALNKIAAAQAFMLFQETNTQIDSSFRASPEEIVEVMEIGQSFLGKPGNPDLRNTVLGVTGGDGDGDPNILWFMDMYRKNMDLPEGEDSAADKELTVKWQAFVKERQQASLQYVRGLEQQLFESKEGGWESSFLVRQLNDEYGYRRYLKNLRGKQAGRERKSA